MKQNKQESVINSISVGFILLLGMVTILSITNTNDIARLEKHDTCLTQAITELPDPNDTTERTLKLTECMDK